MQENEQPVCDVGDCPGFGTAHEPLPRPQQSVMVGRDQVLIIRLNTGVTPEQARQFRDMAREQADAWGIKMFVVVADEIAAATRQSRDEIVGYRVGGLLYSPQDVTVVKRWEFDEPEMAAEMDRRESARKLTRLAEDLGDDPDGDNTPGMGDH